MIFFKLRLKFIINYKMDNVIEIIKRPSTQKQKSDRAIKIILKNHFTAGRAIFKESYLQHVYSLLYTRYIILLFFL